MDGWIKLSRDLLESKQFANPVDLKVWVWLMLTASTTDRNILLKIGKGSTTISLKRGQLIFGRNKAEAKLHIDGSTIYRVLQRFQEENIISIQANNQFSIITVNDFIESQVFEENENLEFEEIEQPMNNQRTTNEQPKNNQRTTNGQPTNTVKESINSKEGLEFKESEKSNEAQPINGSAAPGQLFETEPVKASGKKEKSTAPQKEKKPATVFQEFIRIYDDWHKKENEGMPPVIDAKNGQAAKSIISHLRKSVQEKAKREAQPIDEAGEDAGILAGWQYILSHWNKIEIFYQQKTRLIDINSNLQIILKQVRNGNGKNHQGVNGAGSATPARDITKQALFSSISQKYGTD